MEEPAHIDTEYAKEEQVMEKHLQKERTKTSGYASLRGNSNVGMRLEVNLSRESSSTEHHEEGRFTEEEEQTIRKQMGSLRDNSTVGMRLEVNLSRESSSTEHHEEGRFTEEEEQTIRKQMENSETYFNLTNETEYQKAEKKGLNIEDDRNITRKFGYLKSELEVTYLCNCFYQDGYFSDFDMEEFRAEKVRYKKVDIFLRKLLRLKPQAYRKFLQYLHESNCKHVCEALEEPVEDQDLNNYNLEADQCKDILKENKEEIIYQLEPDVIADMFVEYGEFTIDEYEEIIAQETRRKKSEAIYNLLMKHTERAYFVLIEAIRKKTDNKYLLTLLTTGNNTRQSTEPTDVRNQMKIVQSKVRVRETARTAAILKESEEFELKVTFKNKQLEVDILKAMGDFDVKVSVNDNLIVKQKCSSSSFKPGSIIITLTRCRPDSFKRIFDTSVQEPVLQLLQQIFLHPDIKRLLPSKGVQFDLALRCFPTKSKEKKSDLDVIETHFDFLVEELDALTFLTPLKNQGILSEKEANSILEATPVSRVTRTKLLLRLIQEKKEENVFMSILKDENKYVWKHIHESKNRRSIVPEHYLVSSYKKLADNMSPNLVAGQCCVKEFTPMDSYSGCSREILAKFILQHIMLRDVNTRVEFLNLLFFRDQIPPDILTKGDKENMRNDAESNKKEMQKKQTITRPVVVFAAEFIIKEIPAVIPDNKEVLSSPRALPMSSKETKHSLKKDTNSYSRALQAALKVSRLS